MTKFITLVTPATQPSKEQILLEIIKLSTERAILRGLKAGTEDDDAVILSQVKAFIQALADSKQDKISFVKGGHGYYVGGDGNIYLLPQTGTIIGNDPVLNGLVNGTKNGSNRAFTTEFDYLAGTLMIIRNGMFDHNITEAGGNNFVFAIGSDPPVADDTLVAIYCRFSQRTVLNGVVTGTQDGVNTTFDVADNYEAGSLMLIRNGIFDHNIVEGVSPTTTFTITNAPGSDDILYAIYKKL